MKMAGLTHHLLKGGIYVLWAMLLGALGSSNQAPALALAVLLLDDLGDSILEDLRSLLAFPFSPLVMLQIPSLPMAKLLVMSKSSWIVWGVLHVILWMRSVL